VPPKRPFKKHVAAPCSYLRPAGSTTALPTGSPAETITSLCKLLNSLVARRGAREKENVEASQRDPLPPPGLKSGDRPELAIVYRTRAQLVGLISDCFPTSPN